MDRQNKVQYNSMPVEGFSKYQRTFDDENALGMLGVIIEVGSSCYCVIE